MTQSATFARRRPRRAALPALLACVPLIALILGAPPARATFALKKAVFSGGGSVAAGGSYRLGLTVGETGVVGFAVGATRTLGAGFWPGQFWFVSGVPETPPPTPTPPPRVNAFEANRPNPFLGGTTLAYAVASAAPVRLRVFDVSGRLVSELVNATQAPGRYSVAWAGTGDDGAPLVNGIYFCRLEIGAWSQSQKLIKLR